MKRITQLTRV